MLRSIYSLIICSTVIFHSHAVINISGGDHCKGNISCNFDGVSTANCHCNGDVNTSGNSESRGSSSDLHCEVGYVGIQNGAEIFVTKGGLVCTKSEVLQAEALFGNWTRGNKVHERDKVLEGSQAILAMIIAILKRFNNDHPYKQDIKRFANFKNECVIEFLEKRCVLENTDHYCFKEYNGSNEPRFHFKDEESRKKVENWVKRLNDAKV